MSDDDVIVVEFTASESAATALAFTGAILAGIIPKEILPSVRSVAYKMEAAIAARKMTNWDEGV